LVPVPNGRNVSRMDHRTLYFWPGFCSCVHYIPNAKESEGPGGGPRGSKLDTSLPFQSHSSFTARLQDEEESIDLSLPALLTEEGIGHLMMNLWFFSLFLHSSERRRVLTVRARLHNLKEGSLIVQQ